MGKVLKKSDGFQIPQLRILESQNGFELQIIDEDP